MKSIILQRIFESIVSHRHHTAPLSGLGDNLQSEQHVLELIRGDCALAVLIKQVEGGCIVILLALITTYRA